MAFIDLAIVAAFVLHAAAAGARNRRAASRNLDEYFLAGPQPVGLAGRA